MELYHIKTGIEKLWEERDALIETGLRLGEYDKPMIAELKTAAVMLEKVYRGEIIITIGEKCND